MPLHHSRLQGPDITITHQRVTRLATESWEKEEIPASV